MTKVLAFTVPSGGSCSLDGNLALADARDLRTRMLRSFLVGRGDGDAARDAELHGFEPQRIDCGRFIALCAGVRNAAQGSPDDDVAGRGQLGARIDVANDDNGSDGRNG